MAVVVMVGAGAVSVAECTLVIALVAESGQRWMEWSS